MTRPKVAVVGTGGTISTRSRLGSLDSVDYMIHGDTLTVDDVLATVPEAGGLAHIVPVNFRQVSSTAMDFETWRDLVVCLRRLRAEHGDLSGIVILHGTATMEETAYFLHLTARLDIPIVLTGAQRPLGGLSSDGPANLCAAIRLAGQPAARDMGVLVCLNDEIHAARDVTKSSTNKLQTFQSLDFGPLGTVDSDGVFLYRRPLRRDGNHLPVDIIHHTALPAVEVLYSVTGGDARLMRLAATAGVAGLVIVSFAGGRLSRPQAEAARELVEQGLQIVLTTRAQTGRAMVDSATREIGCIPGDNLSPQKARILLSLALAHGCDRQMIAAWFATC